MARSRFLILKGVRFSSSVDTSRVNFDHSITALRDDAEQEQKKKNSDELISKYSMGKLWLCQP